MIVESTGAILPRPLAFIAYLARRARGKTARDGTRYGRVRNSATSFFTHHVQRISMAAARGDVNGIVYSLRGLRQRVQAGALGPAAGARRA